MRLPVFVDANLLGQTPHGLRSYNVLDASGNAIKQITVPVYLPSDRRNTTLATFNTGFSVANTWYNSMAVTVRRPFANGLEILANYTWAHATDTGQVQAPTAPSTVAMFRSIRTTFRRERTVGHRYPQPLRLELLLQAANHAGEQDRQELSR